MHVRVKSKDHVIMKVFAFYMKCRYGNRATVTVKCLYTRLMSSKGVETDAGQW